MKLSVKALALATAIIWSGAILTVGCVNMIFPGYAGNFLEIVGSIYPGYHPGTGLSGVIVGSLYGFVDAGIGGLIFAWLYNLLLTPVANQP